MSPKVLSPDLLPEVRVRAADEGDIGFIVETETTPEYAESVLSWPADTHRANLSNAKFSYFIALDADDALIGYAILNDLDDADKAVQLQRIVVNARGHGLGRAFLNHVINAAFNIHHARRLWLAVFTDSDKAIRAYRRLGLIDEGVEKDAMIHNGKSHDVTTMAILEDEWRDLHA
jgi:RimJ/RimL family protein N-acetyltransferase